jgi:hypothetical protein
VTLPGKGRLETRGYTAEEIGARVVSTRSTSAGESSLESSGVASAGEALRVGTTRAPVDLLGRALTPDEAREVTHTARRIAALILLQSELDKNYPAVKAAATRL